MKFKINLNDDNVRLVDYIKDPYEGDALESWYGVEGLIADSAEEKFGPGTAPLLREAFKQQQVMKAELPKRYGLARIYYN